MDPVEQDVLDVAYEFRQRNVVPVRVVSTKPRRALCGACAANVPGASVIEVRQSFVQNAVPRCAACKRYVSGTLSSRGVETMFRKLSRRFDVDDPLSCYMWMLLSDSVDPESDLAAEVNELLFRAAARAAPLRRDGSR